MWISVVCVLRGLAGNPRKISQMKKPTAKSKKSKKSKKFFITHYSPLTHLLLILIRLLRLSGKSSRHNQHRHLAQSADPFIHSSNHAHTSRKPAQLTRGIFNRKVKEVKKVFPYSLLTAHSFTYLFDFFDFAVNSLARNLRTTENFFQKNTPKTPFFQHTA
jgi:hypothetical protein